MVVEEECVFYFEYSEFEVFLIYLKEDIINEVGYIIKVIGNVYIVFNVCKVFF